MKINSLILSILTVISVSCRQTSKENFRPVTFYHYQLWLADLDTVDLKDSSTLYLDSITTNKNTEYFLRNYPNSDSLTVFSYSIKGDSLFYEGTYCKVVDTVDFDFKGQKITLYRSNYDISDNFDEESYIFWNRRYGLIGEYNYNMGPLLLFDNQEIPNFATDILYSYIVDSERGQGIE
jgi:hypothetical protein